MALPTVLCAALVAVLLSGCTDTVPEEEAEPRPQAPAAPQAPPPDEADEPLVLVTAADRAPVRLSEKDARALLAGRESTWNVLHLQGTPDVAGPTLPHLAAVRRRLRADERALVALPASALDATLRPARVGGIDPLRQPDSYPLRVAGPAPGSLTRLTIVGDVMLARRVPDPAAALAPMAPRLRRADITLGTLESTLSASGQPQQGGDSFAADPAVVSLLADAGFDAVSVANNHVGDFEVPALLETLRLLRAGGVTPFGAGRDRRTATRAAVIEHRGVRFGFFGFNAIGETPRATASQPGALSVRMPPRTGPLVEADLRHVERAVARLERRVDVVVVLPHWGTQYTHVAEPVQHLVASRLADAGADLVVGGHPHWVQGVDTVGSTLVAHSLGNFVFDMDFMTQTQEGVVLETVWWGDELKGFDLVPYRMDADFAPRAVRGAVATDILTDVWAHSRGPFRPR